MVKSKAGKGNQKFWFNSLDVRKPWILLAPRKLHFSSHPPGPQRTAWSLCVSKKMGGLL